MDELETGKMMWKKGIEPEKTAYEKVAELGKRGDHIVKSSCCSP